MNIRVLEEQKKTATDFVKAMGEVWLVGGGAAPSVDCRVPGNGEQPGCVCVSALCAV